MVSDYAQVVDLTQYRYVSEWPDGVYPGEVDWNARRAAMAAHPAGKGLHSHGTLVTEEFAEKLAASLTPLDEFEEDVYEVMAGLAALLISKQGDYGPDAINLSPGGPLVGINVRMHDKFMRAQHLRRTGATPNHESLVDTYRDLANYAVIAVMVLEGTWPQ